LSIPLENAVRDIHSALDPIQNCQSGVYLIVIEVTRIDSSKDLVLTVDTTSAAIVQHGRERQNPITDLRVEGECRPISVVVRLKLTISEIEI
jgi:hypothetical protein